MANQIQEWINDDDKLYNLIIEIQSSDKKPNAQAEIAFNKLCELYDIPRMPEDVLTIEHNSEDVPDSRSLFEEHALLKFLAPENEDPRGIVLSAAHNILHNNLVNYYEVAKKEYNNELPDICQIGVSGEGYTSKVIFFQKETQNWEDLGCLTIASINKQTTS
ncbi:MAG: hypothetical protein HRT69_07105 [Flavobacteriaceae bacterium]|nr:hypothetical protein [Flavobacteriaceae bacterium]